MAAKKLTQNIDSTVVVSDIRNFTGLFNHFQYSNDASFMDFMNRYIELHLEVAEEISSNYYVSSTGDGVLTIFMSDEHYLNGYAFALSMHRKLHELCNEFNKTHEVFVNFGIGVDSGNIWKICQVHHDKKVYTYLGGVINRATRIESQTKMFSNVNMLIGQHTFRKLVRHLYPAFYEVIEEFYAEYELTISDESEFISLCKKLMLFFISDVNIRGIDKPVPLFKISNTLLYDNEIFWGLISNLIGEEKKCKLLKMLEDEGC